QVKKITQSSYKVDLKVIGTMNNGGEIALALNDSTDITDVYGNGNGNAYDGYVDSFKGESHNVTIPYQETDTIRFTLHPDDIPKKSPFKLNSFSVGLLAPNVSTIIGNHEPLELACTMDHINVLTFRAKRGLEHTSKYTCTVESINGFNRGKILHEVFKVSGEVTFKGTTFIEDGLFKGRISSLFFGPMKLIHSNVGGINTRALEFKMNLASSGLVAAANTAFQNYSYPVPFQGGTGIDEDPFLISDVYQLQAMKYFLTKEFKLVADIDASNTKNWNEGEGFEPIGSSDHPFKGSIDGDEHHISGLYINRPDSDNVGLLGYVKTDNPASVKNIALDTAKITGKNNVGGLIGQGENGNVGIEKSYSRGLINGENNVGGLAGSNVSISNSFSRISVHGNTSVGGLVGSSGSASSIEDSYAAGNVMGNSSTGGLLGTSNNTSVGNSFWDIAATGQSKSPGGGTGKSTAEMKKKTTYQNWDFSKIWGIHAKINNGYPFLQSFNQPPYVKKVIVSGKTTIGSTLTGSYQYEDLENDKEGATITQWVRSDDGQGTNLTEIQGASSSTYTLQNADDGKYIAYRVVPVSGNAVGDTVYSSFDGPVSHTTHANTAPVITSSQQLTVAEDVTKDTKVGTVTGSDADGDALQGWTIRSGNTDGIFALDSATGELSVQDTTNLDYEQQASYTLSVQVSDGTDSSAVAAVLVQVGDVNDNAPAIFSDGGGTTGDVLVYENTTSVTTVAATDKDTSDTIQYSIAGGTDQSFFSINATSGALSFKQAPDAENPADQNKDNVYEITVRASDGLHNTDQALS
ncbi:MAG TPA: cadherin domain-containing protein, partial [Balneolaceae bacterium]|nr:cadherin domain-containing protein [Balneolaceae bacterium]